MSQHVEPTKAPFTLRSIFGTARIKLVPVPLFWLLDYLFSSAPFALRSIFGTVPLFGSWNQKSGTGTNFIRAVPKIERSVNGAEDYEPSDQWWTGTLKDCT
jgi:hypothetical protein